MRREKHIIFYGWLAFIAVALYFYFFQNDFLLARISGIAALPPYWGYAIFLLLSCARGLTFIPATYLLFLGLVFLSPVPVYVLTLIGGMVSSATIYLFADYLGMAGFFERKYAEQIERLKLGLRKSELPILIGWSLIPVAPADLLCYVCGSLRIDIRKLLLGILIGQAVVFGIYVFAGREILLFLLHKLIGG